MSYGQLSKQLVTYHGDSDDEEAESTSKISDDSDTEKAEFASANQSPVRAPGGFFHRSSSAVTTSVRNVMVRPRIQAAPTVSLVSYDAREDDDEAGSDSDDGGAEREGNSGLLGLSNFLHEETSQASSLNGDSPLPPGASTTEDSTVPRRPPRINLPPIPPGQCKATLQAKIVQLLHKQKQRRVGLNKSVQNRKDFRNPSIYEKLVSFLGLDELGSNFEHQTFDEKAWDPDCYFDVLGRVQKEHYEKKEKEKAKRMQVEFVSGTTVKRPAAVPVAVAGSDAAKKRKTKWDMGGAGVAAVVAKEAANAESGGPNALDAAKKAAMTIGLMHQPLRRK